MAFMIFKGAPSYNSGSFVDTLKYYRNSATYTIPEIDPSCQVKLDFFGERGCCKRKKQIILTVVVVLGML